MENCTALGAIEQPMLPVEFTESLELASDFAKASKAPATVTDHRLAARNVAAIVKAGAARLGFDAMAFGGHSLRSGFVTSAVKRGANLIKITDVTGHKSLEMLRTYSREAEAFVGHAGAGLL
jgi:site-specific recombinase XerD